MKIIGTDYENFTSNDYAYNWVAGQLNVVIIGDVTISSLEEEK